MQWVHIVTGFMPGGSRHVGSQPELYKNQTMLTIQRVSNVSGLGIGGGGWRHSWIEFAKATHLGWAGEATGGAA